MKKVFVQEEEVDNSARKEFGDPLEIARESQFLIHLEDTDLYEADYLLHCQFTDDGYLQLIYYLEGEPVQIAAQFKNKGRSSREELIDALKRYLRSSRFWVGYPIYQDSVVLTKEEFETLVDDLKKEYLQNMEIAQANQTPLIRYMEYLGLEPKAMGDDTTTWFAICPERTVRHPMDIYAPSDSWSCGYCGKAGGYQDFLDRVERLYLKKYHTAINSGNEVPDYLRRWWSERY